jgi:M3 family oligoendopeptidase
MASIRDFDIDKALSQYAELHDQLQQPTSDGARLVDLFMRWERLRREVAAWKARSRLALRQDVSDESAASNARRVAEAAPAFEACDAEAKARFIEADNRRRLEPVVGAATLARWESDVAAFTPVIAEDLTAEAGLVNRYFRLIGELRIVFRGSDHSLTDLASLALVQDRSLRREAAEAGWSALRSRTDELDTIFDKLVRCRASMADKLGYRTYIGLAYKRLGRVDYGPAQVTRFRDEVAETIVPLAARFACEQAAALALESLMPWDEAMLDALPPQAPASAEELLARLLSVGRAIHPSFHEFVRLMIESESTDLSQRSAKAGGAFCTFLSDAEMPFVFANYTGTSRDVGSVVHELGHAFQNHRSRTHVALEHIVPTNEIGEIHSMALELLADPLYEELFQKDATRYHSSHVRSLVAMLPYIAAVDHFQELVYAEPAATPGDRCEMWLQMERRYLPWKSFGGIEPLERGRRWQRQRHIYAFPFYYIDYGLAMCCALQLWLESIGDRAAAMQKYLMLCSLGGTLGFQTLLDRVSIRSPFKAGTLAEVVCKAPWNERR